MDFFGGITGDRGYRRDWWRSGDAFVELESAGGVRMAGNYLLAGYRTVRSLQDSVRRLWSWLSSLECSTANTGANGRAMGEDVARGAREVPPELARTLQPIRAAGCQADCLIAGR